MENYKFIHLLYVPTMACNMACRYCYLEENTVDLKSQYKPLETLKYTVDKLRESNIIPFNISLHGGEVTTLSHDDFELLIKYIYTYYQENKELLEAYGFKALAPHIKTNLYGIDKHIDIIRKYGVSISGSLDLPFILHDKYRVTKSGQKTLNPILQNVELLKNLPNKKKVSATIFKEHFEHLDEMVEDNQIPS